MKFIILILSFTLLSCATPITPPNLELKPSVWKGHTTDFKKTDTVVFTMEQVDPITGDFSGFIEDEESMSSSGVVKGKVKGSKLNYTCFQSDGSNRHEKVRGSINNDTFSGKYQLYTHDGKKIKNGAGSISFVLNSTNKNHVLAAKKSWNTEIAGELKKRNIKIANNKKVYDAYIKNVRSQNRGHLPIKRQYTNSGNSDYYRATTDAARIRAAEQTQAAYYKADAQRISSFNKVIGNMSNNTPTFSQPDYQNNTSRPRSYNLYNSSGTKQLGTLKPINTGIMPIGGWGN